MSSFHFTRLVGEKRGWVILPSYIGIMINHEIRIPSLTNQYFMENHQGPLDLKSWRMMPVMPRLAQNLSTLRSLDGMRKLTSAPVGMKSSNIISGCKKVARNWSGVTSIVQKMIWVQVFAYLHFPWLWQTSQVPCEAAQLSIKSIILVIRGPSNYIHGYWICMGSPHDPCRCWKLISESPHVPSRLGLRTKRRRDLQNWWIEMDWDPLPAILLRMFFFIWTSAGSRVYPPWN